MSCYIDALCLYILCLFVCLFVYRLFYRHELTPVTVNDHILEPRILAISSVRQVNTGPTLRSGTSHQPKETQYLSTIEGVAKKRYLTREQLLRYINGEKQLNNFEAT